MSTQRVTTSLSALRALGVRGVLTLENAKTVVFFYVLLKYTLKSYRHVTSRGPILTVKEVWRAVARQVLMLFLRLPHIRRQVDSEMSKAFKDIEDKLVPQGPNVVRHLSLPAKGRDLAWIQKEMDIMDAEFAHKTEWSSGKLSGAVYHGGDDLGAVIMAALKRYVVSNPLHPDVFPAVRKMEAEIVSMCLRMYNHPSGAGATTSGGTESIIMSCRTHRDWARAVKGITEPEMIIPVTAHAAFDKGGDYLGIKIHHIAVDPVTRQVDIKRVARAINRNTIMVVGSAVNFPDGSMDNIVALGALAKKNKIGLHVDCCLGSFIVPFLEKAGFSAPPFDFRVEGVTAISCDTHKYGFAPKGSSVIMYRDAELRKYQYYVNPHWTGGVYASPSMSGSRPGALIAGTWAAMHYIGEEGYVEYCRQIVKAAKTIETAIRDEIPELHILGTPVASVVAFRSRLVNVLQVGDLMRKRGWHLNALQDPPGVHIACTRLTLPVVDTFVADLKDCVKEAKTSPPGTGTMVALYGLGSSSAVGPAMVSQIATAFLDTLYKA